MSLRINQNIAAMNAYRNLSGTTSQLSKSLEKLSSGLRINRAADDAAGLVISENLRSQVGGLSVALRNAQDGISVVQTAEGSLQETTSSLQRIRDLVVQAKNTGATDATAQAAIQTEVNQLLSEIDRIATTTRFGSTKLLDGTYTGTTGTFQVGANQGETITVGIGNMTTGATGLAVANLSVTSATALASVDAALDKVTKERGNLGAYQNRIERTISNLSVARENLAASESRIRDTDMADEMTHFTRSQILQQAGVAMLAQANSVPQSVLRLLS
ncbi:MAG: flagellin FliC [Actinomycetota bacterium]|nr:flagellin FliC [Actinomycetota bacterium]